MAETMIVIGVLTVLFGAGTGAWALRSSDPVAVAFRYQGAMFMAIGGTFIVSNVFAPSARVYAVLGVFGAVVLWAGWRHVATLRGHAAEQRSNRLPR